MQDASIVNAISRLKGAYILQIRVLQDFRLPVRQSFAAFDGGVGSGGLRFHRACFSSSAW